MSNPSANLRIVLKNATRLASGSLLMQAMGLVTGILLTRYLQAAGYGQYAFSMTYAWFFSMVIAFGTRGTFLRDVSRQRDQGGHYITQIGLFRCMTGTLALLAACTVGLPLDKPPEVLTAMILFVLQAGTDAVFALVSDLYRSYEDMRWEVILYSLERAMVLVGVWVATSWQWSLVPIIQMMVCAALIRSLLLIVLLRRVPLPPLRLDWPFLRYLVRQSIPFLLVDLTLAVSMRADILLLSLLRTDQEVGYYNAAYTIILNLLVLPTVLIGAMQPTTARLSQENVEEMLAVKGWLMRNALLVVLPVIACLAGAAPLLMVTLFGPTFAPGAPILRLLAACLPVMVLSGMAGNYFFSTDRQMTIFRIALIGALLNVGLNLMLIPRYGAAGSAVATWVAETANAGCLIWLCRDTFGKQIIKVVPPIALAALVAFGLVAVALPVIGWLAIGLGLAGYGLSLVVLGAVGKKDWQALQALWQKRAIRTESPP